MSQNIKISIHNSNQLQSEIIVCKMAAILYPDLNVLTLKHRETHGCIVSTVATDALVLKHQVISILNAN